MPLTVLPEVSTTAASVAGISEGAGSDGGVSGSGAPYGSEVGSGSDACGGSGSFGSAAALAYMYHVHDFSCGKDNGSKHYYDDEDTDENDDDDGNDDTVNPKIGNGLQMQPLCDTRIE